MLIGLGKWFIIQLMFSRFTEKAIQAIMLAQEEAKRFHHSYVGTEHVLLGIIGEGDNVVLKVLRDIGVTSEQVKAAIEDHLEYGGLASDYGNIPFPGNTFKAKMASHRLFSDLN